MISAVWERANTDLAPLLIPNGGPLRSIVRSENSGLAAIVEEQLRQKRSTPCGFLAVLGADFQDLQSVNCRRFNPIFRLALYSVTSTLNDVENRMDAHDSVLTLLASQVVSKPKTSVVTIVTGVTFHHYSLVGFGPGFDDPQISIREFLFNLHAYGNLGGTV